MISVERVSFAYGGGADVLTDVSLSLGENTATTVIGPSGCGKTTLLYLISGLLKPISGSIRCGGSDLAGARRRTAIILQDYGLFPWKTVSGNVGLGLQLRGEKKAAIREAVLGILDTLGLSGLGNRYPSQLSGGQRQRVAIGRALALEPELLLMDEPFSALDALTREELQELLLGLWRKRRLTTILVTHSVEEAVYLGQSILVMTQGCSPRAVANPLMGSEGYRNTESFFEKMLEVRQSLERDVG